MALVPKNLFIRQAHRLAALSAALALRAFAADPAPTDVQARFEVDYLTDLIDHHQAAVEMAQLAAERTERTELRELAASLVTKQTEEIGTLQEWLEEWYGETHEPALDRGAERQVEALAELEGDEFEQAFLRALSLHDADTLGRAGEGLLQAYHSELIDLIREHVATVGDEIALLRGWLLEWHEINEVTPRDRPDNRRWSTNGRRVPVITPGT
jgi:uncharacterized protein (DUF305 family)